jgi:hypothetical protein
MRLWALWGLCVLLVGPLPAQGGSEKTGDDLLYICTYNSLIAQGTCLGYIEGIATVMHHGVEIAQFQACIPEKVTIEQHRDIVVDYLKRNAALRHYLAAGLVAAALAEASPCPKVGN